MNLFQNIALNNRRGASEIVSSYGMNPADTPEDLTRQLGHCVKQHGDSALRKVAMAHPDKDLFLEYTPQNQAGNWDNACGCNGNGGYSNMNGQSMKAATENEIKSGVTESKSDMLIMGGIIVIALALILKQS